MSLLSRLQTYLLLLCFLTIGVGGVYLWVRPSPVQTIVRLPVRPYAAPEMGVLQNLPSAPPELVKVYEPTEKQRKKIEKELGGKLPEGKLSTIVEIGKLPHGGKATVTINPAPSTQAEKGGAPIVTIFQNKAPFFEWAPERTLGVFYGPVWDNGKGKFTNTFLLEFRQDLFRTGPVIWGVRLGYLPIPSNSVSYAMVGGSVKF